MLKRILLVFCLGFTVFAWSNSSSANGYSLLDEVDRIEKEEDSRSSGPNYFLLGVVAFVWGGILRLMVRTPLAHFTSKAMLALGVILFGIGAINYVQKKIESFDLIAFITGDDRRGRLR